jgi:osmoprotectant transport system ATP-binding protein
LGYLLMVGADDRPIGWLTPDDIPADGPLSEDLAESMSPLLTRHSTLKDALSLLLADAVMAGIVVDERGRTLGLVTMDQIARTLRDA